MQQVETALRELADQDRALTTDELIRSIESRLASVGLTPLPARGDALSRRPYLIAVVAAVAVLVLIGGIGMLVYLGQDEVAVDERPVATTVPAPPTTITATTAPPLTGLESTGPESSIPQVVPAPERVAAGFDCAHVAGLGYGYQDAVAYWVREGRPDRMDLDGNGIPCEAVYPAAEIDALIHFDASVLGDDTGSGDGGPHAPGLSCAAMADLGTLYQFTLAYWLRTGAPAAMDTDDNGIPCETAYRRTDIEAVLAFDGTPFRSPGPLLRGWAPSTLSSTVALGCCDQNASGPASPPLPPAQGGFPDDGEYLTEVVRDDIGVLTVRLRRWIPCSDAPEQCLDPRDGDVTGDRSAAVTRLIPLDENLTVVVHPIVVSGDVSVVGDGIAFGQMLAALDDAYDTWLGAGGYPDCIEPEKTAPDTIACPFVALWGPGGILAYRGMRGSSLVIVPWVTDAGLPARPPGLYLWDTALVISDGRPILHVGAGRIAG